MLTFLFALAAIWTLFWLIMYLLDWGGNAYLANPRALCSTCSNAVSSGAVKGAALNKTASQAPSASANNANAAAAAKAKADADARAKAIAEKEAKEEETEARVKAAREQARAEAAKQANAQAQNNAVKKPVADKHDQANVKPLFVAPKEKDDLKVIKGIGVVMEKTLNELGITTFKQLAGFKQAEVQMVTEALDASNSGFGDRINRDEWVDQAKVLARKAS